MLVLSGKDWVLFCASTAEHQIFDAVDLIHLGGVDVPVEHDHLHVLGVGRISLWGLSGSGMGPKPDAAEHGIMEGDEDLLDALSLGLVQPVCICFICCAYLGRSPSHSEGDR